MSEYLYAHVGIAELSGQGDAWRQWVKDRTPLQSCHPQNHAEWMVDAFTEPAMVQRPIKIVDTEGELNVPRPAQRKP